MMPWLTTAPHANLLTSLTASTGTLSPAFSETMGSYTIAVPYGTATITLTAMSEDPKATINVNSQSAAGKITQTVSLAPGINTVNVAVTAQDGVVNTYQVVVTEAGAATSTALVSSNLNSNLNASVTFTATVASTMASSAPTGTVTFLDGSTTLGSASLNAAGTTTSTATYTTSALSAATHTITAAFAGAAAYASSTSTAVTQIVSAPAFTSAFSPSSLTVSSGATGSSTLTLTPVGGFTGTVTMACGTLPSPDLSCTFAPSSLTFTGTNAVQTSTLTVGTKASAELLLPGLPESHVRPGISFGFIAFPALGMLTLLRRRRSGGRVITLVGIALLSVGAAFAVNGCSGGGNGNQASPGTYTIPVAITSSGTTTNLSVSVVVH